MKILFVCHGNINRSAAAEIICRKLRPGWEVKSCGVATTDGKITASKMRAALERAGYEEQAIRSSVATEQLMEWASVIYYMDHSNLQKLVEQFGDNPKYQSLAMLAGVERIPDPHFDSNPEACAHVILLLESGIREIRDSGAPTPDLKIDISAADLASSGIELEQDAPPDFTESIKKFAEMLEEKLLGGYGEAHIRKWATVDVGVPWHVVQKIREMIRASWKIVYREGAIDDQRAGLRAMYLKVYRDAMAIKKLDTAVRAIEGIARLEGLDAPQVVAMSVHGQITNVPRTEFSTAINRLGTLLESKTIQKLRAAKPGEVIESTNGHAVLDAASSEVQK